MMSVEVEEIRAWVDGELGELRAGEVASAVSSGDKLQRTADALRASALPYREAYEQASVPEVPESLRHEINALRDPATQYTSKSVARKSSSNPVKMFGIAASVMLAAQLVYLGADGVPLALCYMVGRGDGGSTTTHKNHYGLNTAEWSGNGHRFVIVSDAPESTMGELSESTKQQWGI